MAKIWEYEGYTIDEGLKPHDENYKPDYYQYFFLIKKDGKRLAKVCVWAQKDTFARRADAQQVLAAGQSALADVVRAHGLARAKKMVHDGRFANILLRLEETGEVELPLDTLSEKLV